MAAGSCSKPSVPAWTSIGPVLVLVAPLRIHLPVPVLVMPSLPVPGLLRAAAKMLSPVLSPVRVSVRSMVVGPGNGGGQAGGGSGGGGLADAEGAGIDIHRGHVAPAGILVAAMV